MGKINVPPVGGFGKCFGIYRDMIQFLNVLFSYIKNNSYIQSHPVIGWMQVLLFIISLVGILFGVSSSLYEKLTIKDIENYRAKEGDRFSFGDYNYTYNSQYYMRDELIKKLDEIKNSSKSITNLVSYVGFFYVICALFLHSIAKFGIFKVAAAVLAILFFGGLALIPFASI